MFRFSNKLQNEIFLFSSFVWRRLRSFKLSFLMLDAMAVFLCYNVQTIDFCVSVTNQAEWGALWLYNAVPGMKCDVITFIIVL